MHSEADLHATSDSPPPLPPAGSFSAAVDVHLDPFHFSVSGVPFPPSPFRFSPTARQFVVDTHETPKSSPPGATAAVAVPIRSAPASPPCARWSWEMTAARPAGDGPGADEPSAAPAGSAVAAEATVPSTTATAASPAKVTLCN